MLGDHNCTFLWAGKTVHGGISCAARAPRNVLEQPMGKRCNIPVTDIVTVSLCAHTVDSAIAQEHSRGKETQKGPHVKDMLFNFMCTGCKFGHACRNQRGQEASCEWSLGNVANR